jgi:ATP phosphoribosyltransferase regulatory subunit HisZ
VRIPGDSTTESFHEPEAASATSSSAAGVDDVEAQRAALDDLAHDVVKRGMASPAIFLLESMRPISFITAEFLVFLDPFARLLLPSGRYALIVEAFHDRANLTWLLDRIEALEEERLDSTRKPEPSPSAESPGEPDDRP